ncbi:hypothetical protein FOTG_07147 [Fusarium oxysporum f. sp. vasinfectum 25433]|uniref:Uncharacterized protein n=1 Tax=Fusarium oxysporum f. sp. vasinfectum 25433 TaxID=1089449 RepID=X0LYG1_FUSOX|nr:hypothetical protein FOTG_07147 [Fusarium oxysporum f. sp. vasinfectum 25433]
MTLARYQQDVEEEVSIGISAFSLAKVETLDLRDRAGQACFLCLETRIQGQYALPIPCLRPTRPRRITRYTGLSTDRNNRKPRYEKMQPWSNACESDTDIYQRLVETCYQQLGRWKRWLPYYGITDVIEVKFRFARTVDLDGHYPIHMNIINIEETREKCNIAILRHLSRPHLDVDNACWEHGPHSDERDVRMSEWGEPCIRVAAKEAEQRLKLLDDIQHLKKCARDPASAKGLRTLEGMAQESCIYDVKGSKAIAMPLPYGDFRGTYWIRGIHLALGWQKDRMYIEIPFRVSCFLLMICFIWFCAILWREGGGDWGTSFALAQAVAASIAIVISYARF